MTKQAIERLGIAFLTIASAIGCARENDVDTQNSRSRPTSSVRVGLYAFDGSNTDASRNSVIHQIHNRAELRTKSYFEGTDLAGSTVPEIIEAGKARVCNDWRAGRIDAVALTGYSRGAVIALAVAHELLRAPGTDGKEGCDNVDGRLLGSQRGLAVLPRSVVSIHAYIERTDKPVFANIALLDAVNTMNYNLSGQLPAQIRSVSPSTLCFHFQKANPNEHVLTTLHLQGCQVESAESPARHQGLAQLPEARDALERALVPAGVVFRNTPNLSGLPPANYGFLCRQVRANSSEPGNGYNRCVRAGCSWQGSVSGQGNCVAPERITTQSPEGFDPIQ